MVIIESVLGRLPSWQLQANEKHNLTALTRTFPLQQVVDIRPQ